MADTPLDKIIGEGADAGPGAASEAQRQPVAQPSTERIGEGRDAGPAAPAPQPEPEGEKPGMWAYAALKDERQKRQAFQAQARELQEERDALLQQQLRQEQAQYAQPQQQSAAAADDFWSAPEGYVENKLKNLEANFSFRLAHVANGEGFERAWSDMIQLAEHGDRRVVQWVMSTPDPGAAMMLWHKEALQQQRQQQGGRTMPSNFSGARNVGSRSGPGWSGPVPLEDIFDRGRR